MSVNHGGSPPVIRSPFPRPGTTSGTQKYREFIGNFVSLCGDVRLLWLPSTMAMPTTSADRYARTLTNTGTFTLSALGSGVAAAFDASTNYVSVPDSDTLSFGNGVTDTPFSIVALANVTNTALARYIVSKFNLTTGATKQEWEFFFDTADALRFTLSDDSAGTTIGRMDSTPTQGAWHLQVGTYDGARAEPGCQTFEDDAATDDASTSGGAYVAMENLTGTVLIGARTEASGSAGSLFSGSLALVAVVARVLTLDDQKALKDLCNAYFQLTL